MNSIAEKLCKNVDIEENVLFDISNELCKILLSDNTTSKNIIWATNNYQKLGKGYDFKSEITIDLITGENGDVIKPRVLKTKEEQQIRSKEKAEVFTPAWICNAQNNLVDNAWFDSENMFNTEIEKGWVTNTNKVQFPEKEDKSWKDYVQDLRLEITCGEAPYLTSRYDAVSGNYIEVKDRIGLLDRKLRVISERVDDEEEWTIWAYRATQSIYGYDYQGDNVFLARENILINVMEFYKEKFKKDLSIALLFHFADVISWNIWQMDGLKQVIPNSCVKVACEQLNFFGEDAKEKECEGCATNNTFKHTGIYCKIMDWRAKKTIRFVDLLGKNR